MKEITQLVKGEDTDITSDSDNDEVNSKYCKPSPYLL